MARERTEIEAIANNPAAPTFDNTIVALERSGRMLDRVSRVFFALASANTNDTLDKVEATEAPKLAALQDAIYLNPKLFARVKAVYEASESLRLDPESLQLLKITYDAVRPCRRNPFDPDKAKLHGDQHASWRRSRRTFRQKLLAATKARRAGGGLTRRPLAGLQRSADIAAAAAGRQESRARRANGCSRCRTRPSSRR